MVVGVTMDVSWHVYFTDRLASRNIGYDCLIRLDQNLMSGDEFPWKGHIGLFYFCIRPHHAEKSYFPRQVIYPPNESFSFEQLYALNITSDQLYMWSAPMDIIERYQIYVDTLDQSMSYSTYLNCTPPWFGTLRQYTLKQPIQFVTLMSVNGSCYTHLHCDRGPSPFCLQWFEICDGKIDYDNHGIDELYCDQLETNECQPNKFRCRDGSQCIEWDLLDDDMITIDRLDGSDEALPDYSHNSPLVFDNLFSSKYKCPRGQLSCGNGECISDLNECQNQQGFFLMYNLLLSYNLSQACKIAMSYATVVFFSPNCNGFCSSYDN